jgi:hypothetical protein
MKRIEQHELFKILHRTLEINAEPSETRELQGWEVVSNISNTQ